MTRQQLTASLRGELGSAPAKHLRNKNILPGVVYGHNMATSAIQLDALEASKYLATHGVGANLDLDLGGEKIFVLIKEIQTDCLLGNALHIDFQALTMGEKVKVKVPLHFIGAESLGSDKVLQELTHEIEVQVLPKDLIEGIDVDVTGGALGDSVKIDELPIATDDRFEILSDLTSLAYTITAPTKYEDDMPTNAGDDDTIKSIVENVSAPAPEEAE